MIPARVAGATRVLGAPADWDEARDGPCCGLPIRDERHAGLQMMTSAWEPTPEEIAAIVAGAPVLLTVIGPGHPPVAMAVGKPAEEATANG